jgi:phosphatidylglycerophosphatase A
MVGVGIFFGYRWLFLKPIQGAGAAGFLHQNPLGILITGLVVVITVITLSGIWAASRVERLSARKDPGKVVIDEVAGQLIALLPILPGSGSWWSVLVAFLLFRFFDIVKPYPARKLEKLEGGMGIMCDDLVAGVYAAIGTFATTAIVSWLQLS